MAEPTEHHFVPIVLDIPEQSPSRGNLTGYPRRLKDITADWHNAYVKYRNCSVEGVSVLKDIANILIESRFTAEGIVDHMKPIPNQEESHLSNLQSIVSTQSAVVDKLSDLTDNTMSLASIHSGSTGDSVYFQSWPVTRFLNSFREWLHGFRKDLELKRWIVQHICHSSSKEELMFYVACWTYEPYLPPKSSMNCVLHETGFL